MEPVRIKYLGLFHLTKSGYVIGTAIGLSVVIVALLMTYPTGLLPPFHWPWEPVPDPNQTGLRGWLHNHFYEVVVALLLLEVVDIAVTLRTFARKEAEQRATAGRKPASPSH
jgi:hypothetical protein